MTKRKGMIQLYAKVSDLIPSEPIAWQEELLKLKNDIYLNGMKNSILIKPNGYICRGNTRMNVLEDMGKLFIPIDLGFFIGLIRGSGNVLLRKSIIDLELHDSLNNKCLPVYEDNSLAIDMVYNSKEKKHIIDFTDDYVILFTEVMK